MKLRASPVARETQVTRKCKLCLGGRCSLCSLSVAYPGVLLCGYSSLRLVITFRPTFRSMWGCLSASKHPEESPQGSTSLLIWIRIHIRQKFLTHIFVQFIYKRVQPGLSERRENTYARMRVQQRSRDVLHESITSCWTSNAMHSVSASSKNRRKKNVGSHAKARTCTILLTRVHGFCQGEDKQGPPAAWSHHTRRGHGGAMGKSL